MLAGLSAQHKKQFERMLASVGTDVTLKMPPAGIASGGNSVTKALGTRTQATGYGPDVIIKAIIHTSITSTPEQYSSYPSGLVQNSTVILAVSLADALLTDDVHGLTQFEKAKEVQVQGTLFKVTGVERAGLPPAGPYILWVGLKGLGS